MATPLIHDIRNAIVETNSNLAFLINFELNLYEHQSTYSPNMPFRFLIYVAEEYQKLVDRDKMYRSTTQRVPTPRFFVFYNGEMEQQDELILKLSDMFEVKTDNPQLELKVTMLNINYGRNKELLQSCKSLQDYAIFVYKVRNLAKRYPIEKAVQKAVEECIAQNHLREYLEKYRDEVIEMSIYEYNEEQAMKYIRKDEYMKGKNDGKAEGKAEAIIEMVVKKLAKGQSIEQIADALEEEPDDIQQLVDKTGKSKKE